MRIESFFNIFKTILLRILEAHTSVCNKLFTCTCAGKAAREQLFWVIIKKITALITFRIHCFLKSLAKSM